MSRKTILVTGAAGNAGQAVGPALHQALSPLGYSFRFCDVAPAPVGLEGLGTYLRCDTRTASDAEAAVAGVDAVVHLAAWHCGHQPPVSDATIFAVNVGGTFNILEACRRHGVGAFVFASSMAYGHGSVYSVTKVLGEELVRAFHVMTGASVVSLRYHAFVPGPYLEFGARLLRNGVDRGDVARATVAAMSAALDRRVRDFTTVVHTRLGAPPEVIRDFAVLGPDWLEVQMPGAERLLCKYGLSLPESVEQHDLGAAREQIGWEPRVNFLDFLRDLARREARAEDLQNLWVPGGLPEG